MHPIFRRLPRVDRDFDRVAVELTPWRTFPDNHLIMFRRFCFHSRSFVAMLLAFCLVSASLWSYGAEAMADALSDEVVMAASDVDFGDHAASGKVCNHGCHAQTHLMGLDPGMLALNLPDMAEIPVAEIAADVPTPLRDGLFRPPRTLIQA